jgi:hypothetical protein
MYSVTVHRSFFSLNYSPKQIAHEGLKKPIFRPRTFLLKRHFAEQVVHLRQKKNEIFQKMTKLFRFISLFVVNYEMKTAKTTTFLYIVLMHYLKNAFVYYIYVSLSFELNVIW